MLYNSNGLYTKNDLSQCTNNIQPSTIVRLAQLLHYYMIFYVNTDKSAYIFIKTFLFWHNYIFTRNGTDMQVKVPCALTYSSPMLPSIVQCQNQKIDIGAVCRVYSDFTSYICNHLRVSVFACVLQCNSITNAPAVTTRNIVQNSCHHKAPLSCYTCNLSFSSLAITNLLISIILLFHECSVNRIVQFVNLRFFLMQHNSLGIH